MKYLNDDIRKFILEEAEAIQQRYDRHGGFVPITDQKILKLGDRIKSRPKDPGRKVIFDTGVKAFCQTLQASLDEGWAVEVISWTEHCQMVAGLAVLVKVDE